MTIPQIVPTAFDAEDWLKTTNAKSIQLWMEVNGEDNPFCEMYRAAKEKTDS